MGAESVVVIVGRGSALERALDAQGERGMPVLVFPSVREATGALPVSVRPRIGAVLVSLLEDHEAGLDLVKRLRSMGRFIGVPITVWTSAASPSQVTAAYASGASSVLVLGGGEEDAQVLTRTIHYWRALNEPSQHDAATTPAGHA